ncbi:tetratricopeptide repeat protein [Azospirillum baldaniorum]|uniref:tetratricopeptide repeat protein n=1 Tax=Azospirillum baldaniorum TaxID=1064539 RepID=UPI00119FDF27|nr:tetratricopeptide repeat protein [Azospirillum baldaniorum]TWA68393.1 tetratricopeptide repeat protein [Azospirillum baldaniorum]
MLSKTFPNPESDEGAGKPDSDPEHDRALEYALLRAFLKERVGFQFGVAVVDDDRTRAETIDALGKDLAADGIEWVVIDLRALPDDAGLLAEIRRRITALDGRPAAVGVVGIEWHLDLGNGGMRDADKPSPLLTDANFQRDVFPEQCPVPLVLWVTSLALSAISRLAPDLWHWRAATFDLCVEPPDLPVVEQLDRLVPRPDQSWQAQPKEEAHRRIALLRRMLEEISSDGDERRVRLLIELADATEQIGDYYASLQAGEEALAIAQRREDRGLVAASVMRISRILARQGQPEKVLELNQNALKIYESLGDMRSRAVALGEIARSKASHGAVDEALTMHQEELGIYESLGDARSRALTLGDIARLKTSRGAVDEALALHQEELGIYESLSDERSRALTLGDIAALKAERGEVNEALALHQEALGISESLGDERSRSVALMDIARLKAKLGAVGEALALHQEALTTCERNGYTDGMAAIGLDIARLLAKTGKLQQARALAERSLALFTQLGWPDWLISTQAFLDSLPPPGTDDHPTNTGATAR